MSVHWPIIKRLLASPTRVVATDDRRSYKGIEILVAAMHVASLIEKRSSTQTVATMFPSSGAFPICALAAWMLGRTVVPLNFLLSRDELKHVIGDCETDLILTARPMLDFMGYTPECEQMCFLEDIDFKSFPEPRWPKRAEDDEVAAFLYTSGTSGLPKGVKLTHANISANINQVRDGIDLDKNDCMFGVLPQFHSFGFTCLTLMPLSLGIRVVFAPRFVPHKIVAAFREHRPTVFVGIPSMYNALLSVKDAGPEDFESFRALISGGEPLPKAVADKFEDRYAKPIFEGYGLTETSPVTHVNHPGAAKQGTVGKPLPGVRQRIIDIETNAEQPPGRDGEIRLKGPNIFAGYHNMPEETEETFDDDGWFRTGDIGRVDPEGYLSITGRHKEMLIVGGENVFPREIEEVLNKHESVKASGVIGADDGSRGEVPVAFVELAEDAELDASALRSFCRERLAGYKVPKEIHAVDELPRNPTGKIMRRKLKPKLDEIREEKNAEQSA